MRYEIHVDTQPTPEGGWAIESFFVEVHHDDNPEWPSTGGRISTVSFKQDERLGGRAEVPASWDLEYINQCVITQLKLERPELFRPPSFRDLASMNVRELLDALAKAQRRQNAANEALAEVVDAVAKYARSQSVTGGS